MGLQIGGSARSNSSPKALRFSVVSGSSYCPGYLDCLRNYALFEKKLTRINSRIKEMTMMSDEPQVKNPQLIHLMHLLRADQNDETRAAFYAGLKTAKFMLPVGTARTGDPTVVLLTDNSGHDFLPIFTDQARYSRRCNQSVWRKHGLNPRQPVLCC